METQADRRTRNKRKSIWERSESEEEGHQRRIRRAEAQNHEPANSRGSEVETHRPQDPQSGGNPDIHMQEDAGSDLIAKALGPATCMVTAAIASEVTESRKPEIT